jgi:hypothetical protein
MSELRKSQADWVVRVLQELAKIKSSRPIAGVAGHPSQGAGTAIESDVG